MKKRSLHKGIAWALVVLWMGVIFYLSHQPGGESSALSSGIVGFLVQVLTGIMPFISFDMEVLHFFVRKFAHFSAYFLLGVLTIYAVHIDRSPKKRTVLLSFFLTVSYAVSDELHQLFIPGRSGEVRDVLIDSLGSAVGMGLYITVRFFVNKGRASL